MLQASPHCLFKRICLLAKDTGKSWRVLRKLPMRQIEVAELLAATANFTVPYVKALLAAAHPDMLVEPDKYKIVEGLTPEQVTKMEREMEALCSAPR